MKLATVTGAFLYSNSNTISPLFVAIVAKIPSIVAGVFTVGFTGVFAVALTVVTGFLAGTDFLTV